MAPANVSVARQGDEDRLIANVQMGASAVALEAVTVSARRGSRLVERAGPGAVGRSLSADQLARLPVDALDLKTVAALAPGVLALAATDSTEADFSVAGQRSTANAITLDGLSLGSGSVPQEALRSTRVVTSSYDAARGQFSGGLVASTTRSGKNIPQGSFTYTLRDRSLAWGQATASPFGQGYTQNQLSGGMGGPLVRNRLFVFGALQGRWRGQALPSLVSADPLTLARLGVSPDSASRFLALAAASGAPAQLHGLSDERTTENTVVFLRFDLKASEAQTLTLRLDGRWDSQQPTRVSTLGLPPTGGTRTERAGGVMAALTSHFAGSLINEVRGYLSADRKDATALVTVPAGRVQVASDLPGGRQGVATLTFGGNAALPQRADNVSLELSEELSWLPGGGAHRPKLGALWSGTGLAQNQTPNQLGTFVFPSLAALAADSPASFSRVFAPSSRGGTAWNAALYLADSWRTGGLQLTYGTRLEAARFSGPPPYNRAADSLFALRTDRIPRHTHLSPRIGFVWTGGEEAPTILRGGIGDFQSPTPTALYGAALGAPGLSNAETELVCVGSAVPTPDWLQYASDPSTIPGQCADTGSTVLITPQPNVTAFARDYAPPHVWRASLGVQRRLLHAFTVSLDASYARGASQYGFRDLNLAATPRFALPDEAGRSVYVPPDSIVPATGALGFTASRVHPQFGQVLVIGSDLQSDTRQVTLGVGVGSTRGAALRLSYTFTRARDQSSFSCCAASHGFAAPTTAANPNVREWATSDLERRHAFLATVTLPIATALELGAIARLTSGAPFTPMVGSDVNGDGARNDRAFVFAPATAPDTAVGSAMRTLIAGAPGAVRRCLESQLARVAARNSCTGPWQPSLDVQLSWRPAWFGLERRLTLSLLTVNLLGGLDEWLHGSTNLRGWGYASAPDPVLLYVHGFDPATARFRYAVNG
ncbi:MAG: TonB-dependent receptor, partial [Deltaproteobacteria bacterium]